MTQIHELSKLDFMGCVVIVIINCVLIKCISNCLLASEWTDLILLREGDGVTRKS